jgi:hypothetical protein
MRESTEKEVAIKGVGSELFSIFLEIVYGKNPVGYYATYAICSIADIADRFDAPDILSRCLDMLVGPNIGPWQVTPPMLDILRRSARHRQGYLKALVTYVSSNTPEQLSSLDRVMLQDYILETRSIDVPSRFSNVFTPKSICQVFEARVEDMIKKEGTPIEALCKIAKDLDAYAEGETKQIIQRVLKMLRPSQSPVETDTVHTPRRPSPEEPCKVYSGKM